MRHILAAVVLMFGLAAPAWAGLDEGVAAHRRGDYATALREFRQLAEQGEAVAQNLVGVMYAKGQGVTQDYAEAVRWYRKAAEQDHGTAQNNLGVMYEHGQGVPQDYVQAHMWFNLAVTGSKKATKNRDNIAKRMTPADVSKAQRLAKAWWTRHGKK